jgi:rSAM/selenodomain-associated transferase 1
MRRALVVIGKAPVPGAVKTRLAPALTPDESAALYRAFLADTLDLVRRLGWERVCLIHPRGEAPRLRQFAPDVNLLEQPSPGLGRALQHAFAWHFEHGFEKVILIGSDNPTLGMAPLVAAEAALSDAQDLTVGPTSDGGYYLIGMRQPHLAVFERIEWSTSRVYAQTVERAQALGLNVHAVDQWYDVDEPADLSRLVRELAQLPPEVGRHTRSVLEHIRLEPVRAAPAQSAPRTPP